MGCDTLVKEIDALQVAAGSDSDLLNALNTLRRRYNSKNYGCTAVTQQSFKDTLYDIFPNEDDENKLMALFQFINDNQKIAHTMYDFINTPQEDQDGGKSRRKSRRHRRKSRRNRRKN